MELALGSASSIGSGGGSVSSNSKSKKSATTSNNNGKQRQRQRLSKQRPRRRGDHQQQRFANYLVFGFTSTVCLCLFALCYLLVLAVLWPLLDASTPESMPDETPRDYLHHMHVPPSLRDIAQKPVRDQLGAVTAGLRTKLAKVREGRGVTDANLLDFAVADFERKQEEREEAAREAFLAKMEQDAAAEEARVVAAGKHRNGFVVLGMHRSGTSMMAGLLHKSAGYVAGGPLIGGAFDNEMGFFERIDVVLQNDEFMNKQHVWWNANVMAYDPDQANRDKESGVVTFKEGERALKFLNDPNNAPWLQKDPRMCITLPTWLKLMNNEPAVVFTYRHPLEVASSIHKREAGILVETGLRLWIVYNMRAIQNSRGLCMVRSSNERILKDPLNEVQRISDALTSECRVPAPPNRISQEEVDKFVNPKLQHNKKKSSDSDKAIVEVHNGGDCVVRDYDSTVKQGTPEWNREHVLYKKAMKIYCDFQSGEAYEEDYEWPTL